MASTAYKPTVQQPMHNTKGNLTASQLACGDVQVYRKPLPGYQPYPHPPHGQYIQVTLWREHGVYHVRAHNFATGTRLLWRVMPNLRDARRYFHQAVKHVKEGILA